jgi:hypothetical protein
MKDNEKNLVNSIVDFEANVMNAQHYLKENYNIDSTFDSEKSELKLVCNNINESLMLCAAREYVNEQFGEEVLHVVMG